MYMVQLNFLKTKNNHLQIPLDFDILQFSVQINSLDMIIFPPRCMPENVKIVLMVDEHRQRCKNGGCSFDH